MWTELTCQSMDSQVAASTLPVVAATPAASFLGIVALPKFAKTRSFWRLKTTGSAHQCEQMSVRVCQSHLLVLSLSWRWGHKTQKMNGNVWNVWKCIEMCLSMCISCTHFAQMGYLDAVAFAENPQLDSGQPPPPPPLPPPQQWRSGAEMKKMKIWICHYIVSKRSKVFCIFLYPLLILITTEHWSIIKHIWSILILQVMGPWE